MRWAILGVTVLAAGCAYRTLNARGAGVKIAEVAPTGCERLGVVVGKGGAGGAYVANGRLAEYARDDVRNRAAELGATHVTLSPPEPGRDAYGTSGVTVTGLAYRCARDPGTAAAPSR